MTELLHKALPQSIIGVYYDVYNGTSRIYPERFYDRAMLQDLSARKIRCVQQPEYEIVYKERIVGKQILDILIAKEVVVEDTVMVFPAAIQNVADLHLENFREWLRVQQVPLGILANFYDTELKPIFLRP